MEEKRKEWPSKFCQHKKKNPHIKKSPWMTKKWHYSQEECLNSIREGIKTTEIEYLQGKTENK